MEANTQKGKEIGVTESRQHSHVPGDGQISQVYQIVYQVIK